MKKVFGSILAVVLMGVLGFLTICLQPAQPVYADSSSSGVAGYMAGTFLGFKPWYDGVADESGNINAPNVDESGTGLASFVWHIVLNIVFDLTLAIGYIALAMVVYGGYMYIMSQGDPGKAAKGKKTLSSAVIGVVIAMGASVIVNTLIFVLGMNNVSGMDDLQAHEFKKENLQNVFSWAYAMAGLVAVVFLIKSGADFMLSQGEASKVQKAKHGVMYAVIGLVIVILASIITSVIIKSVGGAIDAK